MPDSKAILFPKNIVLFRIFHSARYKNILGVLHSLSLYSGCAFFYQLVHHNPVRQVHCNNSCRSFLNISSSPYVVYTNMSSFVGVRAVVDPQCTCHVAEPIECLNGGTALGSRCECPPGLEGPQCELLAIGFHGDGYAIMPSPGQACDDSYLGKHNINYLTYL